MKYQDLIIWQYRGKPKAAATARLIVDLFAEAYEEIAQIPEIMNIDTATGKALDLCGKRVGQSRILRDFYPRDFFGFKEAEGAKGFYRITQEGGGKWYRYGDPVKNTVVLTDDDYRFLIKCRITKNFQTGNMSAINDALHFIFGKAVAYDCYNMSISIVLKDNISDFKKYVLKKLDILPRPCGVGIGFYVLAPDGSFGFKGVPNARGFNQGKFARIL